MRRLQQHGQRKKEQALGACDNTSQQVPVMPGYALQSLQATRIANSKCRPGDERTDSACEAEQLGRRASGAWPGQRLPTDEDSAPALSIREGMSALNGTAPSSRLPMTVTATGKKPMTREVIAMPPSDCAGKEDVVDDIACQREPSQAHPMRARQMAHQSMPAARAKAQQERHSKDSDRCSTGEG